ncbi:hypothetical protein AMTR_s00089p00086640 [Amborella trichopoda]|uniref:Uncharacterized protein n=1 Tax=Amborella trichopoda TaxID=13333 RepID=W1P1Q0_AMBTC|nr:hypothetical protein AMTR_s00089p00086640 [Amborella trichopoda]
MATDPPLSSPYPLEASVDDEEDVADALQKRRRISGEDCRQFVLFFPSQEEQDQAKNQDIDETGEEQDQAKNEEIEAEEEREEAKNLAIAAGDENQERESGDQEMRVGETSQEGGEAETVVNGGKMAAMIPELDWMLDLSEAQRQELVRVVDTFEERRREGELSDFFGNLQLEQGRLTSEMELLMKRNEELQCQWEEATGAGGNDQPDIEGGYPEPQEPYFDSPF